MTGAAIPFVVSGYVLGLSLIVFGMREREWASTLAGFIVLACLTAALMA